MRIVVGLGNPGVEYRGTRHNAGFFVVEELARRWHVDLLPCGENDVAYGNFNGTPVVLVEPRMFMNCSGEALTHLTRGVRAPEWLVVHDELDLALGDVRLKHGGGTAGHRGLKSIAAHFGGSFDRVRVGIGRPAAHQSVVDFVLSPFTAEETPILDAAIDRATEVVESWLTHGVEATMAAFHGRRPKSDKIDNQDSKFIGRV